MAIKAHLEDGFGTKGKARIAEGALLTSLLPFPPFGEQKIIPFRQYLATTAGVSSMLATGTLAAPVRYFVQAHNDNDRYITQISFLVAGAGAALNQFGNIAALTNGCRLYYTRNSGEIDIHNALKSNFDFVRLCNGNPAFGSTTNAFIASNIIGTAEGIIPILNLCNLMPPYGIKLDTGSVQKIILEIRDTTTAIGGMDAIAYGFDRLP